MGVFTHGLSKLRGLVSFSWVRKLFQYLMTELRYIDEFCEIGHDTYIGMCSFVTKAKIGNYCSIANGVVIGAGEHRLDRVSTSSLFYEKPYEVLTRDDVIIGHDVWIGANAVVLRGVVIGNGAVIGAGAVVTKDIPPYAVAVGVPARVLRYRFDERIQRNLQASEWWNLDKDRARLFIEKFERAEGIGLNDKYD